MKQARTRLTLMAGLCVIGASALILNGCSSSGGGGNGGGGGGGGGGGNTTPISDSSQAAQAASLATTSVLNAVGTVDGLGFTFSKPVFGAQGKSIPGPRHFKDPHLKAAAEIRAKKMASKGMTQKFALMKGRIQSKTALTQVTDSFWVACDNYDGTDGPSDSDGPNGTTGYYTISDTYDNVNLVPETFEDVDVNCQLFNGATADTGGILYDGTFVFGQTKYQAGPGPDDFSADYFYKEHARGNNNKPYLFEFYDNTTNETNVTDLTDLTRTTFFDTIYDLEGHYDGTSTYDDSTGAGSGDTNFSLDLAGEEHFGTPTLDFTFNFDSLNEEGSFSWDDAGFFSADYEDHTSATVNGGFGFDFSADVPSAKAASAVSPSATVGGSLSVSFTDVEYNDDYTEDSTGYDDLYDISGQVSIDATPADVCFEGTFDITTPERIHETSAAFCPIGGEIDVNDNTSVKFNSDQSVDVTVGGNTTSYDDCLAASADCAAGTGLTGNI